MGRISITALELFELVDLLAMQAAARLIYLQGGTQIVSTSAGDVSVTKEWVDGYLDALNWALRIKSPTTYRQPVTRTRLKVY